MKESSYFITYNKITQGYYVMYRTGHGFGQQVSIEYRYFRNALKFYSRVKNSKNYISNIK